MDHTLQLLKQFCAYDYEQRDCEKALTLLSRDIRWFGTSDYEDVCGRDAARTYITKEIAALPTPYEITLEDEGYVPIAPGAGTAFLKLTMTNQGATLSVRMTASSRTEDGVERICAMHVSVADESQKKDEYFPVTSQLEQLARAKNELVMSTIAGGLVGFYDRPGYPLYFVNEHMLRYLGYGGEAEFVSHIDGCLLNGVHPDDREFVKNTTKKQLCEAGRYEVNYRMRRRDGSYLWVHDIGQRTKSETGEPVVISVCYDITKEHEKQAQLDNMINALPGGVALYRLENEERAQILYQSRGVSRLSGRTPEEYAQLVSKNVRHSVYEEDTERVVSAMKRAEHSEETVSLDYRIPHIDGGYVWINGSFRRAGEEGGRPIIHAVFTEMPQLRELFRSITENSGVAITVIDQETHELLYVNQEVFSILHKTDHNYEGKPCYRYLMDEAAPCAYCPCRCGEIDQMREFYLSKMDRYYATQGRTVDWAGRKAYISYMTDITESVRAKKRLAEMLQNITCGVVVSEADPTDGSYQIEYLNAGFCRLLEEEETTLRRRYQKSLLADVFEEDMDIGRDMIRQLQEKHEHCEGTMRFVLSDGRKKWLHVELSTIARSDGMVTLYATFSDVTTQMQQEQQLRNVIHNVPGGICLYRWDGENLHPEIVSEQFSTLLGEDGRTRLEQARQLEFPKVHPDDLPRLQRAIRDAFGKNAAAEMTYRVFNPQRGEYRWLYLQAVTIRQDDGTQLAYASYTDVTDQHLLAQNLRASERALDCATDEAGLWYWKYDPENNRAYFSQRCRQDFNLPERMEDYPNAWLQMDLIPREYTPRYMAAIEQIKSGAPQALFEAQIRLPDGMLHWAEFRFTNLLDEKGKPEVVVCTGHLIDYEKALLEKYELEKQKTKLGEKDLLFHAIFNLDTGMTVDYGCVGGEQHLEKSCPTFEQAVRQAAARIVDVESRKQFLHLNDPANLRQQMSRGDLTHLLEYRRRLPDGRILWVRSLLHLVSKPNSKERLLFEYCYDIHETKMASEVLLSAMAYDYERIASVDFRTGRMLFYGVADDLPGNIQQEYELFRSEYAATVVTAEERERFLECSAPERVMERVRQKQAYTFTVEIRKPDGKNGVAKIRFVAYDAPNQIYIMTRTDVTDLLRGEENKNAVLREALTVAQQANAAKSNFLSAMSHDIRTPMNAIMGMCELAIRDERDAKQIHESLQTIQSSSQLLLSIINNILDMSRIESGKMVLMDRPFSMKEEVCKAQRSHQALAEQKHQNFNTSVDTQHDDCLGDSVRIHSAVDNILSNAIKYTPEGGTIHFHVTENASDKPEIGRYCFEISDNGIGISPEKQLHLFEPFYRGEAELSRAEEGTGLGLSIAKAIVDLKGGTISVRSKEGVGTTFLVELPIRLANKEDTPQKAKFVEKNQLAGIRVLLCEDHPVNQLVATRILERAGATVTIASDGRQGLQTFTSRPNGTFDVILMDIRMPNLDGCAATRAIRNSGHPQAQKIPILAMTANAFAEDIQKSREAGMDDHLAKPVVPERLCEAILEAIKRKKAL